MLARFTVLAASFCWTATLLLFPSASTAAEDSHVTAVRQLPTNSTGLLYPANRAPLVASPLIKLPIGAITPKGWLRHQLELEREGMTGRLAEISRYCKFEGNAWSDPKGHGHSGWEDLPYWLRGYGDLGYVLKDQAIVGETRRWLEAILASQEPDGWFGPRDNKVGDAPYFPKERKPAPDMWPNMLILQAMQSWHENTGEPRVIPFMQRYFRWQLNCPKKQFLVAPFDAVRRGDNLASVYWLYCRTGEPWLLELATKIHDCGRADWTAGNVGSHGVNIAQGFREPAEYYVQTGLRKHFDAAVRNYETVMGTYGQFPGGGFAADESHRPGYTDPRQGFETCSWVELMHGFETLTKISGDPIWADRCEEIAFNSLPAAMTPNLKGLHYLTAANQVQLDEASKRPGIGNDGAMFPYSPHWYTCCQHNVSHGWPYYAEELWLATADRGLCASLYAASEVTAKVADGVSVTIAETTDYPFRDTIELKVQPSAAVRFPLYLRVPRWCDRPTVQVNGKDMSVACTPLSYLRIERTWKRGDVVAVRLPMTVGIHTWVKNQNAVSVHYGPLAFSLKIGERWSDYGGTKDWPNFEVFPMTPWNYGLVLDKQSPEKSFELVRGAEPLAPQPFTPETAPIQLKVKARRIPQWVLDGRGLTSVLQPSPARSDESIETVTLIPMGAARLRISMFPTIGNGPSAHTWELPHDTWVSASLGSNRMLLKLDPARQPANSGDQQVPRFTWWDHRGTAEWVQYDFEPPRTISFVEVYWFDDTGRGGCRVPASWRLLYKDGKTWRPFKGVSGYGIERDRLNRTTFQPVQANGLRIEVQLRANYSGGILQSKFGP